ncbi:hypothetical protein [Embleya sp. MST-111070]|uniref:hypothetical protein n=1 Tax=Embleya sp. MST-111070 TaxID=3398231 RepID=UPI003F737F77
MPTSRPRKSRKRTREIREQSRATGTRFTAALRANDRTRADDQQSPPRLTPTRTLVLPLVEEALLGLYELDGLLLRLRLEMVLDHEGELVGYRDSGGVPIPGAPIEDVEDAYYRVREALPEGTEEFANGGVDEILPPTPDVLLLIESDGGSLVYLTSVEVAEADLVLLAAFADALDRAARPRPGPEFEALREALGEIGRVPYYPWMPEGDEATVARWVRAALSTVLHSPFKGPLGAADRKTLSNVLRYAKGWEFVQVDRDEEEAAERALLSMMRAAEWA